MKQRTPVAAGNWKMNTTPDEATMLCRELASLLNGELGAEVVVFPPFTNLAAAQQALIGSRIGLGAQNLFWEGKGAYTGEISASMVRSLAEYVIIGHSERRQYFGETDETVRKRLIAALGSGLVPIVCVGESLKQRDAGQVEDVLERQVRGALSGTAAGTSLIMAYEPVWAIGTGRAADAKQAAVAMACIRRIIGQRLSPEIAKQVRILYGGSVTPQNAADFMAEDEIDGALVGGASLNAPSFAEIARLIGATVSA